MGTTHFSQIQLVDSSGNTSTIAPSASGNTLDALVVTNNGTVGGTLGVTGKSTLTGQVTATNGLIVGEADSASNEYDFFYVDGTNRPKFNSWQAYDYGTNAFRTCYLYSGSLKIA